MSEEGEKIEEVGGIPKLQRASLSIDIVAKSGSLCTDAK